MLLSAWSTWSSRSAESVGTGRSDQARGERSDDARRHRRGLGRRPLAASVPEPLLNEVTAREYEVCSLAARFLLCCAVHIDAEVRAQFEHLHGADLERREAAPPAAVRLRGPVVEVGPQAVAGVLVWPWRRRLLVRF
jgi:hypothetical protein